MKVKITNFQSIENCDIDIPEKSFTCLVGPTNIGKSSIRRALECVLYNKSEVSYIRKGAKECIVEVTFEDGMHVKWVRDKKTATYEIDGESYAKLAGSVPEPLIQKGFKELVISNDRLNVQVAHQFENIFLLNQTGSRVTEVLSNLGNLNKIISANKECLSDKKNFKSKLKVRKEDFTLQKEKLNSFKGLDEQRDKIETLKKILTESKDLEIQKEKVLKLDEKLNKSKDTVGNLRRLKDVEVPKDDITLETFNILSKLNKSYSKLSNKIENYSGLSNLNDIDFNIKDDFDKFANLKKIYQNLINKKRTILNYKNLPELSSIVDVNLGNIVSVKKISVKLDDVKVSILDNRKKLKEYEENLDKLDKEFHDIKKDLDICPLCDSNFN
ncbi:AAA family ATPase [bacterium]|nr:AAA family ATPase [bacterium]